MSRKWTDREKQLARTERYLRDEISALEKRVEDVTRDRNLYRTWFMGKVEWLLSLMAEGKTPSLKWLVNDMAILLRSALP